MEQAAGESLAVRINKLADWIFESNRLVVLTGAGISTDSGIPDFRGPNGVWTRRDKGLPVEKTDFSRVEPNSGHLAILALQELGKLDYLISQNVDNLHLKSGIRSELLAELHGNITKLRCTKCEFLMDNFADNLTCPQCGARMKSSIVDFGDSLPQKDLLESNARAEKCDLFIVVGSSLVVYPAADIPLVAFYHGARLVIINQGDTPLDARADLRFHEAIKEVLPPTVESLRRRLGTR
jgi:NAD-dependent SIR2 family protein deacetylase